MLPSLIPFKSACERERVCNQPHRVRACKLLRKMRGGAQSHLIAADDGHLYVCKFTNNPQGRRILINEWVSTTILKHLGIFAADVAIVDVSHDFITASPDLYLSVGSKREEIPPGLHLGSRLHVDPERTAIFDFFPERMLSRLENRREFLGALLYDKWAANEDSRQAVFFRAKARGHTGFWVQMIDHGFAFGGRHWHFQDSPIQGVYFRPAVYEEVSSIACFEPWLHRIQECPEEVVTNAAGAVPAEWTEGDEQALECLTEKLLRRRGDVERLVKETIGAGAGSFPHRRS